MVIKGNKYYHGVQSILSTVLSLTMRDGPYFKNGKYEKNRSPDVRVSVPSTTLLTSKEDRGLNSSVRAAVLNFSIFPP